jgi:hypothetical protein
MLRGDRSLRRRCHRSLEEVTMVRLSLERVLAVVGVLALALVTFVGSPTARAADVSVTVDGSQKHQTMTALGADINPHSWDHGRLKPALDLLIHRAGMKTFRVGMDMIDWESRNDNGNPRVFNWRYYNRIYSGQTTFDTQYAGSNFADTWHVIDYLRRHGVPARNIELSFMGPGPSWMGGPQLDSDKVAEFVEEVLSAAYYGYRHGHRFGLFSPDNEMDNGGKNEGVGMDDTQYADVLNRLAGRMNALHMKGVRLVGPETAAAYAVPGYADAMKKHSTLMSRLAHFAFHDYTGEDLHAAGTVAGTGKGFWISEYANVDQTFTYLDQGASGLLMWEAYDSVYNHAVLNDLGRAPGNDSLTYGNIPLLAYHRTTHAYRPRSELFYFGQLFKWVPLGAQRIGASSANGNIEIEAFHDPASGRLTLVGQNTSGSSQTLSLALRNVAAPSTLRLYETNSGSHMERQPDVHVSGGSASVAVPAYTTFTLTG